MALAQGTRARLSANETVSAAGSVWALLLGAGLLMLGNGLQGTLLGVRAESEGFASAVTGLVMSGYFVGFLAGSTLAPAAVARVGHIRVFAALASIASVAILVHGIFVTPAVWAAMRVLSGFAYAGLYVVTESWLNDCASNRTRGRLLGLYMVIVFLAMAGGQLLLNVADPRAPDLFILISVLVSVGLVPILLSATRQPHHEAPVPLGLRRLYAISPLGTVGCFVTGIGNGAIFTMGAVYARAAGLSIAEVSLFMGALVLGGALFQWPLGKLSDRMDRRTVIIGVTLAAAVLAAAAVVAARLSTWALIGLAVPLGGAALCLYPLLLAYTNDYLDRAQMVAASSGLVFATGLGAVLGPSTAGWIMGRIGAEGFLWYLAAIHLVLGGFALYRATRRASQPVEDQSHYVPVPSRTSPLGAAWIDEMTEAGADGEGRGARGMARGGQD